MTEQPNLKTWFPDNMPHIVSPCSFVHVFLASPCVGLPSLLAGGGAHEPTAVDAERPRSARAARGRGRRAGGRRRRARPKRPPARLPESRGTDESRDQAQGSVVWRRRFAFAGTVLALGLVRLPRTHLAQSSGCSNLLRAFFSRCARRRTLPRRSISPTSSR